MNVRLLNVVWVFLFVHAVGAQTVAAGVCRDRGAAGIRRRREEEELEELATAARALEEEVRRGRARHEEVMRLLLSFVNALF